MDTFKNAAEVRELMGDLETINRWLKDPKSAFWGAGSRLDGALLSFVMDNGFVKWAHAQRDRIKKEIEALMFEPMTELQTCLKAKLQGTSDLI